VHWTIVITGGTIAALAVAGMVAPRTIISMSNNPTAGAETPLVASPESASAEVIPATLKFVPSPVIDPRPMFFFGDESNGYYAERPVEEHRGKSAGD
jgi:hypothetical protein